MNEIESQKASKQDPPSFLMIFASLIIVFFSSGAVAFLLTVLAFWMLGTVWPYPKGATFWGFYLACLVFSYAPQFAEALGSLFRRSKA